MGWRFRKSFKIFPGLKLNLSKSGVSLSTGIKGFHLTTGNRGTYLNAGIPGTGIYNRQKLGGGSGNNRPKPFGTFAASVDHTGSIVLKHQDGSIITDQVLIQTIKQTQGYKSAEKRLKQIHADVQIKMCSCGFENIQSAKYCIDCGKKFDTGG